MAISFKCDGCAKQYNVKDELAGKRAQCKKCGQVMKIPLASEPTEPNLLGDGGDASPNTNTETVAGSLISTSMGTVAGRGASVSGQSAMGRSAAGNSVSGRSASGRSSSGVHRHEPQEQPDEFGTPSLQALKQVAQSEEAAFDVHGGTDQPLRRERGPATRNRAPMEPYSFLIAVAMLGVLAYAVYTSVGAPVTSKPYPADVLAEAGKPWMVALSRYGIYAVMAIAVIAPLVLGAWYAALKIINVRTPDGFYMRSLGIASVAVSMLALASAGPLSKIDGIGAGLALVAIGACFALLHFIHGQKPAVSGITTALAAALGYGGIIAAQSVADSVQQPMMQKYEGQLASISKARETKRLNDLATRNGPAQNVVVAPSPEEQAALKTALTDLQGRVDAFKTSLTNKKQTREKVALVANTLAADIEKAKAKYPDHAEFATMAADLLTTKAAVDAFPTAAPPTELAEAPPAGADWSGKAGRREVSAFAFNITPPINGQLDIASATVPEAPLTWQLANSRTALTIEQVTSPMAAQQRPWIAPAFIVDDAKGAAFAVAADTDATTEFGKINGLPATKITAADPNNPGSFTVIYTVHKGPTWLKCTIGPTSGADDALAAAQLAVRSIHERAAGEPVIDPMPVGDLVARYAAEPAAGEKLISLIKAHPNAEDAVVKSMGFSPDESTLTKFAPLLVATATEKNSALLWKIAGSTCTSAEPARDALRSLEPQKADDIAFALMDLKGTNHLRAQKALSTLAYADADKVRQPDVSKALMDGLNAKTIGPTSGDPVVTEAVLEKWFDKDIGAFLQDWLVKAGTVANYNPSVLPTVANVNAKIPESYRKLAMKVLGNSGKPAYAFYIAQLMMVDPDAVTESLVALGSPAEPEVLKLLNTMAKGEATTPTRKAVVRVLDDIGTRRCIPSLQKIASMSNDPEVVEHAKTLAKTIASKPIEKPTAGGAAPSPSPSP